MVLTEELNQKNNKNNNNNNNAEEEAELPSLSLNGIECDDELDTVKKEIKNAIKEEINDRASQLRKSVFNKLPKNYQKSHYYYLRCYLAYLSYITIFFTVYISENYFYQLAMNTCLISISGIFYHFLAFLLLPMIAGWSVVIYSGIGHDASHKAFGPQGTKLGKFLNWFIVRVTWDIFFGSTMTDDHMFHHKYPDVQEDKSMMLISLKFGVIGEVIHTAIFGFATYSVRDIKLIITSKKALIWKLWITLTLINRILLVLGVYYHFDGSRGLSGVIELRPIIGLLNVFWAVYMFNLIAFGPHVTTTIMEELKENNGIAPPIVSKGNKFDMYLFQIRNAWESYNSNNLYGMFMQWLHCGASMHVTHHCFTFLPRSLQYDASVEISKIYKNELKTINSFKQELNIWHNRNVYNYTQDIPYTKEMLD